LLPISVSIAEVILPPGASDAAQEALLMEKYKEDLYI
jgi:hypothetical protein